MQRSFKKGKDRDKIVEEFVKRTKEKFSLSLIIFFGSRAKGDYLLESDYDFLIVSEKFKSIPFIRRSSEVRKILLGLKASFEILCYTPEEFERKKKELSVVRDAIKTGIRVL